MKTHLSGSHLHQLKQVTYSRWRHLYATLFISIGCITATLAQNKTWDKTFGGRWADNFEFSQQTKDGGYILGGTSASNIGGDKTEDSRGNGDYWIVKLNANGTKSWDRTIGGDAPDLLTSMQQTSDGGYILGGYSQSGISNEKTEANKGPYHTFDYWIVKLNAEGKKEWDKTIGGSEYDYLYSLKQTTDGGYILGGFSDSNISGDKTQGNKGGFDYWIVKINATGKKVWDKTIGGDKPELLTSIQQTSDGGYILGGESSSNISGDKTQANRGYDDYWVVKLKADGTKVWDKTFGGTLSDRLGDLIQTSDGGYLLGGHSISGKNSDKTQDSKGGYDYWVIKINATGSKIWDKTIGGNSYDQLTSLHKTQDGGYILGGYSYSNISGDKGENSRGESDFWVIKLKADGSWVWDKTIGGDWEDELQSLQQLKDGSYLLGGTSYSGKAGDKSEPNKGIKDTDDYWIVKLDNSGVNLNQIITLAPIGDKLFGTAPFTLSAQSTSGLPVSLSVVSGPATIKGNVLTLTGMGEVTIKASAAGNATYKPAAITQSFHVRPTIKQAWDKTFGGSGLDNLTAMVASPDGGYLLGGTSISGISGNKTQAGKGKLDYWLVKTDKDGKKIWDKAFGGTSDDKLTVLVATPDGGYLVGGTSVSGISGDKTQASKGAEDFWLIKIDGTGKKIWDKVYGGNDADNLTALVATADGGYLLGGSSASGQSGDKSQPEQGSTDYWLIKINSSGAKLWDKTYGGHSPDNLAAIATTTNGGILLGGTSSSSANGDKTEATRAVEDYWVVRLNADGTKVWDKTFGGALDTYIPESCDTDPNDCKRYYGSSVLTALATTPDEGFLLAGYSNAAKGAEKSEDNLSRYDLEEQRNIHDYWVVKIDKNGNKVWDNSYGGGIHNQEDDFGGYFITGDSKLKTIAPTADGNFILAGTSNSTIWRDKTEAAKSKSQYTPERFDFWSIKINGNGYKMWDKTIGGLSNDYLAAIVPIAEEGYVLAGSSASGIGGDKSEGSWDPSDFHRERSDYWIVKLNDETPTVANSNWNMRYGGSGTDAFSTVIKTSDGGYLSGGYTNSSISGDKTQSSQGKNDYWIVKSDAAGKKLWEKRFGGSGDDYLNTLIQTADGGYLLGGSSLSGSSGDKTQASRGNRDYWVVKISGTGIKQWDKRFGGTGYDELKKVLQLSTGEYLLAGTSSSPAGGDKSQSSRGGQDYWILKLSASGTKLWDKRYGGSLNENLEGLAPTLNGGFLLGGSSASGISGDKTQSSRGGDDYWLVRITGTGTKVWDKRFGGSGTDDLMDLGSTGTATGNFFIAGHSTSGASGDKSQPSQGGKDFWMLKIDGNGNKLFDKRFGGSSDEGLRSILLTKDGGYLLAGRSESGVSGDRTQASQGGNDYWMIKTSSTGIVQWDKRFGGSGEDELRTALQTSDGGYLLGGKSNSGVSGDRTQPSQGGTDYWLVKVAPQTTVVPPVAAQAAAPVEETKELTSQVDLSAYPNPFSDRATIRFSLPETQTVTVKVLDNQGQEVTTLFQGEVKANQTQEVEWKAGNQTPGLYLLELQTPTKRHHFKLLRSN